MTIEQHLTTFVAKRCHAVPGAKTPFQRFAHEFLLSYLPAGEREQFSKRDVMTAVDSLGIERGTSSHGQVVLANLAMPDFQYAVRDGKVVRASL
jgi:hypothetical protein